MEVVIGVEDIGDMEVDLVLVEEGNIDVLVTDKDVVRIDEIEVITGELVTTEVVDWREIDVIDCVVEVEVTNVEED